MSSNVCPEHAQLITAWFENLAAFKLAFRMADFIRYGPEQGWRILLQLLSVARTEEERRDATGELTTLFTFHGDRFIARAEILAREDETFQEALREVRFSSWGMSLGTWRRLNRAAGEPLLPEERFNSGKLDPASIAPRDDKERALAELVPSPEEVSAMVEARLVHARTSWASEEFMAAFTSEREAAETWHLIRDLIAAAPSEETLGNVAAGPLEDFLSSHGEEWIGEVERFAATDPLFRTTLQGVWQLGMSDEIYARVVKAAGA